MSVAPARAIVFAYHQVGVRCLKVLLDGGVEVRLVVSHRDQPGENIWFGSVAALAAEHGLKCITPDDPNEPELLRRARAAGPDFLFSFYYRHMLGRSMLEVPRRGAYNMHGSLLPKYRGRVPVNWAVLHGERETGATLHEMTEKPDNGPIVDQQSVPILGDDTAGEVFTKVVVAAEIVLARSLPRLIDGTAQPRPQDLSRGSYFGGRRPEDGRIPADADAQRIHDLVRALSTPYPGAFFETQGHRIVIDRTRLAPNLMAASRADCFSLLVEEGDLWLDAADGRRLKVIAATVDGSPLTSATFPLVLGAARVRPGP